MSNETNKVIREHDAVVVLTDQPDLGLIAGQTGVVVYVHGNGEAYEVEIANVDPPPRFSVVTLSHDTLLKLQPSDHLVHPSS